VSYDMSNTGLKLKYRGSKPKGRYKGNYGGNAGKAKPAVRLTERELALHAAQPFVVVMINARGKRRIVKTPRPA
jgi:hypothetical protein